MKYKIVFALTVTIFLLTGIIAFGATERPINRLGNPNTAFYVPPLKNVGDLQKMVHASEAGIQEILSQRNWHGNMEDLIRAVGSGKVTETRISPGTRLPFISMRRKGRPAVLENVVWAGKKEFEAYVIEFDSNGYTTRFYVPKPCGNFWFEETPVPEKTAEAPKVPEPPVAPPPPPPPTVAEQPVPPPPPTMERVTRTPFFIAGFAGKQRLVHDDSLGGRCDTLIAVKAGILPQLNDHLEVELAVGGKIDVSETDSSSLFADVALNGLFNSGFIGGGVSFWDLTESDTRAVAALVQLGFNIGEARRIQFVAEARAPFDQFDDLSNNYQVWGGFRFRLGH